MAPTIQTYKVFAKDGFYQELSDETRFIGYLGNYYYDSDSQPNLFVSDEARRNVNFSDVVSIDSTITYSGERSMGDIDLDVTLLEFVPVVLFL